MIGVFIVVCEVAFWAFVLAGLVARYPMHKPRLGVILLAMTPVVDLVLIVATVIDLRAGATVNLFHGLAAVYVGVSVAFGHRMIRWADERFVHHFAGGPPPSRPPKYGPEHARRERAAWYRHLAAWAVGSALLFVMALLVGEPDTTESLSGKAALWACILAIDFIWSFSYTFWPRHGKTS